MGSHSFDFTSVAQSCPTLCDPMDSAARQASLSITNSWSFMSIESVMRSNHLILCHPLLLLPSIFASIKVFSNESALRIRWLEYWSFSFSTGPSNEYSGLISFRIDWFDLLAVQGTLTSLLQLDQIDQLDQLINLIKRINSLVSTFFMVQLSHPYMTTRNTIVKGKVT